MKKVSLICTTYNEEATVEFLLSALATQTHLPNEVIITDNHSTDLTRQIIKKYIRLYPNLHLQLIEKKGNRSVGRNAAIAASQFEVIAITDAGCVPAKDWLEQLLLTYESTKSPVIAGYYKGTPHSNFEEAVVPYALVMPDRVNENRFLPATRSVLLEKKVWQDLGGFDEQLTLNEDYPFAKKIVAAGYQISFARKAVVAWVPRKNLAEFATMIERFAQGDAQAGILRPKVTFLFFRYLLLLVLEAIILYYTDWKNAVALLLVLFVLYSLWAIEKNRKYVKKGWYWLPVLQYTADVMVMIGTMKGAINNFK